MCVAGVGAGAGVVFTDNTAQNKMPTQPVQSEQFGLEKPKHGSVRISVIAKTLIIMLKITVMKITPFALNRGQKISRLSPEPSDCLLSADIAAGRRLNVCKGQARDLTRYGKRFFF